MLNTMKRSIKPVLIAVCGGTACGKTTFCDVIASNPELQSVTIISQDSFYRNLTPEELANVSEFNFDAPEAFDWLLFRRTLRRIKRNKSVEIPVYDFKTNARAEETTTVDIGDVVMIEGLYPYYDPEVSQLFDLKLFIESDDDLRLGRRIKRDMANRGRTLESVLYQYKTFVKPAYDRWVFPQRKRADIIIPWGEISGAGVEVNKERINEYPVIKMITRYIFNFIEKCNFEKSIRSGSAEILSGVDVPESSMSDYE